MSDPQPQSHPRPAARPRPLRHRVAFAGFAVLLTVPLVGAAQPAASAVKPTAIVSMGDSFISGEAAGSYEPGTDQPGNFCHRSQVAEIHVAPIPADASINLACSGATTDNVALGGSPRNGEAPQAERLRAVAAEYDVTLIVLSIGGNDVGFSDLVLDCIAAYFLIAPRCQDVWADWLPAALEAAAPRIAQNIADIHTVMAEAGDTDYQLVLQSYSSPVTEDNRYSLTKLLHGCPIRDDDAQWAREVAIPLFTATLGEVAARSGVRFLDMGPALRGREVCARGITHDQEWVTGINIDLAQLRNGLGSHLVRHSMHPNARGHAQFGLCLGEFYASSDNAASCVRGADGNLHATPLTALPTPSTEVLPYIPEPVPTAA